MTEDDTPEVLEARCWALRERAERAESGLKELAEACDKAKSERDKALAACREHEMLASEIVSDALDPSVNVAWMRCSPDLPKYVRALEAAAGEMRTLMQAMVDSMPAQEGGSLFYERFDGDGNYIGSENIDPLGLIGDWYQRALKGISTDCGKDFVPRSELDEALSDKLQMRLALENFRHADGCFCESAFSGPGCHPSHAPECIEACKAVQNGSGKGWLSPEKVKLLVEALEKLRVRLETGSVDWEIATDALAAVKQP